MLGPNVRDLFSNLICDLFYIQTGSGLGRGSTAKMPGAKAAGGILDTKTEVIKGILTVKHII